MRRFTHQPLMLDMLRRMMHSASGQIPQRKFQRIDSDGEQ